MREPWIYCPTLQVGQLALDDAEARHALRSLRLRPGDRVTVFDGCGRLGSGVIQTGRAGGGQAAVLVESEQGVPPPARTLTLIVAACKGPRLEWLAEKCTELGVSRLLLTEFERSVVHTGPQHVTRLRRTAIEACKQCRRAWLPQIEAGLSLADAVVAAADAALLVAHPTADAPRLATWLNQQASALSHVATVVGPEGGLSPAELDRLRSAGGQLVRIAEHILRVETAALAVAATWAGLAACGHEQ
jgi:16S rRNA (uracil1498-N3)-methyltransferase